MTEVKKAKVKATKQVNSDFSLSEARKSINDLFQPNPIIYWADFLVSWGIGIACFRATRQFELFSWQQFACFLVSSLLFYRLAMFIHELVHNRSGTFNGFRFFWNLLVGIPFLMPTFVYYTHLDHHRRKHYGTDKDGEYLPLGSRNRWYIIGFIASSFVVPFLAVFRFLILTPLTWISPRFRDWCIQHVSSMIIDPTYIRPLPTKQALRTIRLQEFMCFLWCFGMGVATLTVGEYPFPVLIQGYCTGVFLLTINAIRTLGAHRWKNDVGEMTFIEQLTDTVNYPKRAWITEIWGPTGTRYHSLHHLFPSLPYHNMPEAHKRLMEMLPEESPYRETNEDALTSVITDLWYRSKQFEKTGKTVTGKAEAATES